MNYGIELLATGQIFPSLSVYSGLTILNPKLTDTGVATTNDKQFVGIPNYKSNVLFEYSVPKLRGFVLSPDWQHVGRRREKHAVTGNGDPGGDHVLPQRHGHAGRIDRQGGIEKRQSQT